MPCDGEARGGTYQHLSMQAFLDQAAKLKEDQSHFQVSQSISPVMVIGSGLESKRVQKQ
jgi:hypothetical protein